MLHRPGVLVTYYDHLQLPQEVAVTTICIRSDKEAGWGRMRVGGSQHHVTWNENTSKPLCFWLWLLKISEKAEKIILN